MALSVKTKNIIKRTTQVILTTLAALGVYACQKQREAIREEVQREIAAERQERAAQRKANPDYGPGGINRRISRQIAEKGVLSGYVMPDTNIDTLVHSGERKNQPAPMKGPRAGQTHPGQLGNTLINDPKHIGDVEPMPAFIEGETPSNAPTTSKRSSEKSNKTDYSRFKDSTGR